MLVTSSGVKSRNWKKKTVACQSFKSQGGRKVEPAEQILEERAHFGLRG